VSRTYSHALRRVAPWLASHRHGRDMLRAIAEHERAQDERDVHGWDAAEAVHYVSIGWHEGQWCPLYIAACVAGFRPGMAWIRPERGSSAACLAADLIRILRR
jgi:hypothetical protein